MRSLIGILSSAVVLGAAGVAIAQTAPPRPPTVKRTMPAPPVNEATEAYQFRTRVLYAPQCQRFANESDAVFLDDRTDIATKAALLKKIEAEAKLKNCLAPP